MPDQSRLSELIDEYRRLDQAKDAIRIKAVLLEAASLVDRGASPKKWAALRGMYAQVVSNDDPVSAIQAYRDALTAWSPTEDRASWVHCHGNLGMLLAARGLGGSNDAEEAIEHLEAVIGDEPSYARLLATLYAFRPLGDWSENWRKRVQYLLLASSQCTREDDPQSWAALGNELARAEAEEPNADFAQAVERRIARHEAVLSAFAPGHPPWTLTALDLADACLSRVLGDQAENGARAEALLRLLLSQPAGTRSPDQDATARLLLGRCLLFKPPPDQGASRADRLHEATTLFAAATRAAQAGTNITLAASAQKLNALAQLELLRGGDQAALVPLLAHCEAALALLDETASPDERRIIFQIEADARLEVGDFIGAEAPLEHAASAIERLLRQQSTQQGRLERIWTFRDTTALLGYCRARRGDYAGTIAALERGRALLWTLDTAEPEAPTGSLIPAAGALLFPIFAAAQGLLIAVTRGPDGPAYAHLPLPGFGKARVRELLMGTDPNALGGWLRAYSFRNSEPANFAEHIMKLGDILQRELWAPIIAFLESLGVGKGAELVWFPQGGVAALPIHSAWTLDGQSRRWLTDAFALRYAPSLKILARAALRPPKPRSALVVCDPSENLPNAILETEWASRALGGTAVHRREATKTEVLSRLPYCTHLHYAGHARFDVDDPLRSSLLLSNDEELSVSELAQSLPAAMEFVALSACETAVSQSTSFLDEGLGFPTALLARGARRVLATLWSVEDASSAFLIGEFYEHTVAQGVPAAQALRAAQNWLCNATVAELSARVRRVRDGDGPASGAAAEINSRLKALGAGLRPYEHPWYWAGFTIWGA